MAIIIGRNSIGLGRRETPAHRMLGKSPTATQLSQRIPRPTSRVRADEDARGGAASENIYWKSNVRVKSVPSKSHANQFDSSQIDLCGPCPPQNGPAY